MKKTLFLALLLGAATTYADIYQEKSLNFIIGKETITTDTSFNAPCYGKDATHVAAYPGDGEVILSDGATWTLPNALFIGGRGYGLPVTQSGNGKVTIGKDSVINVGDATQSSGGHHIDVGHSQYACTGELNINGGTVNAAQFIIGNGAGTGAVVVTNGGRINLSMDGLTGGQQALQMASAKSRSGDVGNATLILDNSSFSNTENDYEYIGYAGTAAVELRNGSRWESSTGIMLGGTVDSDASFRVSADSSVETGYVMGYSNSSLTNEGSVILADGLYFEDATLANSGSVKAEGALLELYHGSVLDNTGTLEAAAVVLGSDSTLRTGELVISGCETPMNPEHQMQMNYRTGLAEGTEVVIDPGSARRKTVGAYVNGGETMQYLYKEDFDAINQQVRDALHLQVATAYDAQGAVSAWRDLTAEENVNLEVANIIGKNITANVTTDDAHDGGDITVALSGSHLVVRVGDNGASDPTAEDKKTSAEKVGTLGSYQEDVAETDASVRLHTTAAQSTVEWEGHYMETVTGETSTVNDTTTVSVGSAGVEGTLTVVEKSTLQNHGNVASDKVVVNGTLDNNGTIAAETIVNGTLKGSGTMAKTTLTFGSAFIVGNSPGVTTFTDDFTAESGSETVFSVAGFDPATDEQKGWETPTYSQIVIAGPETTATLDDDARVVIAFGGEYLFSSTSPLFTEQQTAFELVLIHGGMADDGTDLAVLLNNTSFTMTKEALGQPIPQENITWHLNVMGAQYSIENSNLILRGTLGITRAPEPATTTLSLLALASLAARRRRK